MLKRILVGLGGGSYGTTAVNQAIALAMAHDAAITGVSVLDVGRLKATSPFSVVVGGDRTEEPVHRLTRAEELVEWSVNEFVEACRAAGVRHQVMREVGEPFSLMTDQARYHDLMVFGLRSLFEFDLIPEPHDALVRLVQAGVRPLLAVSRGFYQIRKVLIAYSGSMESAKTMKRFVQMRLWPDCDVRIVCFEDGNRQAAKLLAEASEYCRAHGFRVESESIDGLPKNLLLPYSESWGADLTVIGNSARNLLLRQVFGETALHAIRQAERPLFLAQ